MEIETPPVAVREPLSFTEISTDAGTANFAVVRHKHSGFMYKKDDAGVLTKVPRFEILNIELWDMKRKIQYYADHTAQLKIRRFPGYESNVAPQEQTLFSFTEHMNAFIKETPWLFELQDGELAELVSELQCGHIKNHELDVFLVGYAMPIAVRSADFAMGREGIAERSIISRAKKYGIQRGTDMGYDGTKAEAEKIVRALLPQAGQEKWVRFLDALYDVLKQHRIDIRKVKVHDCCDALLLGLARSKERWETYEKRKNSAREPQPKKAIAPLPYSLTVTLDDGLDVIDESDELYVCKAASKIVINRRKRAHATIGKKKTVTNVKAQSFFDAYEDSELCGSYEIEEEEEDDEKPGKQKAKKPVKSQKARPAATAASKKKPVVSPKKRKVDTEEKDEDTISVAAPAKKRARPTIKKLSLSTNTQSKYKALDLTKDDDDDDDDDDV